MISMDEMLSKFDSKLFDSLSKSHERTFFYYADMKHNTIRWSDPAIKYFGLPEDHFQSGDFWAEKIHPDDLPMYMQSFEEMRNHITPYHNCEYRITNAEGEYVWVNCRGYMSYDEDGNADFMAGFVTNMGTVTKIDPVTGMWTNYVFKNNLSMFFEKGKKGVVLLMDIHNFKSVNSRFGFDFGDAVLYTIGQEILNVCRNKATVYRIEGTQFAVIMENGTREDITSIKNEISRSIENIFVDGRTLHFNAAYSATAFPEDGQFLDQIQNNLSYALVNAKQSHTDKIVFYNSEIAQQRNRFIKLSDALREDVTNGCKNFSLVMQPILKSPKGEIHSAEALLRWKNEEFPNIGPMEFVPILEQTGDIISVGRWIIDTALKTVCRWNEKNPTHKLPHVNVNFSYIQFTDDGLKDYVIQKLDSYNLPHDTLILELTESCRIDYTDDLARVLCAFRDEGVIIAMDDFGTGYSSLSVLRDIPVKIVKLDHTITRTIADNQRDRNLLTFIVNYAKTIDIDVCVEGVETAAIQNVVKQSGAKYVQGFYFDKPLDMDNFYNKYIR